MLLHFKNQVQAVLRCVMVWCAYHRHEMDQVKDVAAADLDEDVSPEDLILSYVSADKSKVIQRSTSTSTALAPDCASLPVTACVLLAADTLLVSVTARTAPSASLSRPGSNSCGRRTATPWTSCATTPSWRPCMP